MAFDVFGQRDKLIHQLRYGQIITYAYAYGMQSLVRNLQKYHVQIYSHPRACW